MLLHLHIYLYAKTAYMIKQEVVLSVFPFHLSSSFQLPVHSCPSHISWPVTHFMHSI